MLYLWNAFGNPLFPMFNAIFRSPWAETMSYADHRFLLAGAAFLVRGRAAAGGETVMPTGTAWFLIAMTVTSDVLWQMIFGVSRYLLALDLLLPLQGLRLDVVPGSCALKRR